MPTTAGRFSCHPTCHPNRRPALCPVPIAQAGVLVLIAMMGIGSAGAARSLGELPSQAQVEEFAFKAVDVFPIRFGGVLRLIAGSALLVPATLFSTFSLPFDRNPAVYRDSYEMLVREPFDYTFRRPLGQDLGGL